MQEKRYKVILKDIVFFFYKINFFSVKTNDAAPEPICVTVREKHALDEIHNSLDIDNINDFWIETFDYRLKLLKSDISTADYIHRFPCLSLSKGYKLVMMKF